MYTLKYTVPSGDDPATHIYIALKLVADPSYLIYNKIFNTTIVTFEYPNIVHVIMALVYIHTHDVMSVSYTHLTLPTN